MRKQLIYCFIAMLSIGLWSCDDDENYDPIIGILQMNVTPHGNAIGYTYQINHGTLTIGNTSDPVVYDVSTEDLESATISVKTTIGVGLEVYYNGVLAENGLVVGDISKPGILEIRGYNQSKTYAVNTTQSATAPEDETVILKSSDMRNMGIDPNTYNYQVTYFKDKFYCFASAVSNDLADYRIYSSENGIQWEEVNYGPDAVQAVGGEEATLVEWKDRLYVLGGGRTKGTDKWGNEAEQTWGLPDCAWWRSHSTADGTTFKCDTVGVSGTWVTSWGVTTNPMLPTACAGANVIAFNDKMYLKNSYAVIFYAWQSSSNYKTTSDGTNWENISVATAGVNVASRLKDAFFAFKGKMWCIGGFTNFVNKDNAQSSIYSSTDGINWTLEADEAVFGKMWGMKVVTNGNDVAYMIGGEYFNESGERTISDKIYRSTDGIHWEAIETGSKYIGRRSPQVAVKDGNAYIFGGYTTPSSNGYVFDTDMIPAFDTYVLELK